MKRPKFIRLIGSLPARRQRQLGLVAICLLLGAMAEMVAIGLAVPFVSAIADPEGLKRIPGMIDLLDAAGATTAREIAFLATVVFCVVATLAALVRIFVEVVVKRFVFRAGYEIGVSAYRRVINQPYQYHAATHSAEALGMVQKTNMTATQYLLPALEVCNAAIVSLAVFVALSLINWQVALIVGVTMFLLYGVVGALTRPAMRRIAHHVARLQSLRVRTIQESLGAIREIILNRTHAAHLRRFSDAELTFRDAQAKSRMIAVIPRHVIEGIGMVLFAIVVFRLSVGSGDFMAIMPTLVAFAVAAQRTLPLLQRMHAGLTSIKASDVVVANVLRALELPLPEPTPRRMAPLPFERELTLDHVSFRYSENDSAVLDDISLTIRKGASVGILGPTGSGKSTLVDIMMGLLEPTGGRVLIDGEPLTGLSLPRWRARIAHVPQSVFLTDASIRENIAFEADAAHIDDERVRRAAEQAGLHEFIASLPQGYDTMAGERGIRFSGGQRQRLVIARALYRDPDVLVFDEATSALDVATEQEIMRSIAGLRSDLTIIMIAHRLSTLEGCDMLVQLADGRIAEIGTYDRIVRERAIGPARAAG